MQAIQTKEHFNLLIDDGPNTAEQQREAKEPFEYQIEQSEEAVPLRHVRTSEAYEYAPEQEDTWAEDELIEEPEEEDELAYKEVFYELINNAIVQNRQMSNDLDDISERTNEDENSMDPDRKSVV